MIKIKWNAYTWYSKLATIIFFIGIFPAWCFYLGMEYQRTAEVFNEEAKVIISNPMPPRMRYSHDYRNGTYSVGGVSVTLSDGVSTSTLTASSSSQTITSYFGNEAKGDLNSDGSEDVVFLLTQRGGGSGTFYYAAVGLRWGKGYLATDTFFLGDRIAPQSTEIHDGEITINYADRKEGEPMVAKPSVAVSRHFKIVKGKFAEVK